MFWPSKTTTFTTSKGLFALARVLVRLGRYCRVITNQLQPLSAIFQSSRMRSRQYSFSVSQFCFHFIQSSWSELNLLSKSLYNLIKLLAFSFSWSTFPNSACNSSICAFFLLFSCVSFLMRSSILSMISSYILHCLESMSNFNRISFISPISFFIVPRRSLKEVGEREEYLSLLRTPSPAGSFRNFPNSRRKASFSSRRTAFQRVMKRSSFSRRSWRSAGSGLEEGSVGGGGNSGLVLWEGRKLFAVWFAPILMVSDRFFVELACPMRFLGE